MEEKIGRLNMKPKYVAWTVQGKKFGTTRMNAKPLGLYSLWTEGQKGPMDTGAIVRITKILKWSVKTISKKRLEYIAHELEHFRDGEDLIKELVKLNANRRDGKVFKESSPMFTHVYKLVSCPPLLAHIYVGRPCLKQVEGIEMRTCNNHVPVRRTFKLPGGITRTVDECPNCLATRVVSDQRRA
jgi:hypothetical protein